MRDPGTGRTNARRRDHGGGAGDGRRQRAHRSGQDTVRKTSRNRRGRSDGQRAAPDASGNQFRQALDFESAGPISRQPQGTHASSTRSASAATAPRSARRCDRDGVRPGVVGCSDRHRLRPPQSACRERSVDPTTGSASSTPIARSRGSHRSPRTAAWSRGHGTTRAGCCSTASLTTRLPAPRDTPSRATRRATAATSPCRATRRRRRRSHIELWLSGPFHAIGILRPTLKQTSYGHVLEPTEPDDHASGSRQRRSTSSVGTNRAPEAGDAHRVPRQRGDDEPHQVRRRVTRPPHVLRLERPIRRPPADRADARRRSPRRARRSPVPMDPSAPACCTGANTSGVASSILGGDNAVVVVPDAPLATGTYTVAVTSNAGPANWSFDVDPNAPLTVAPDAPPAPLADTKVLASATAFQSTTPFRFADSRSNLVLARLPAGQQVRIQIAGRPGLPADVTAVSANFTGRRPGRRLPDGVQLRRVRSAGVDTELRRRRGHRQPGGGRPRAAALCVSSRASRPTSSSTSTATSRPRRRRLRPGRPEASRRLPIGSTTRAGEVLRVVVAGGRAPRRAAAAVALNLTAVLPGDGWIRAFPCDAAEPAVST